mmetsp:Transcript_6688/g.11472  ORF Transcript_6688/g.11472 Transcript_6688/m.11472 type:complete len:231 (-) Transcript_6688:508-1200(-)
MPSAAWRFSDKHAIRSDVRWVVHKPICTTLTTHLLVNPLDGLWPDSALEDKLHSAPVDVDLRREFSCSLNLGSAIDASADLLASASILMILVCLPLPCAHASRKNARHGRKICSMVSDCPLASTAVETEPGIIPSIVLAFHTNCILFPAYGLAVQDTTAHRRFLLALAAEVLIEAEVKDFIGFCFNQMPSIRHCLGECAKEELIVQPVTAITVADALEKPGMLLIRRWVA